MRDPTEIILQYTNDIEKFIDFINNDVYPNVGNRNIKSTCTRLLNKLKNPNDTTTQEQTPLNSDDEI